MCQIEQPNLKQNQNYVRLFINYTKLFFIFFYNFFPFVIIGHGTLLNSTPKSIIFTFKILTNQNLTVYFSALILIFEENLIRLNGCHPTRF